MVKKTRLSSSGHNTRRDGSFAGKAASLHPVGKITRMMSSGHNTRRDGSFAGKTQAPVSAGVGDFITMARKRGRR